MKKLTEDMCMEILLVHGSVFTQSRVLDYWTEVFAMMQKRWPEIIDDLGAEYPSVNSVDMHPLDEFYSWLQNMKERHEY